MRKQTTSSTPPTLRRGQLITSPTTGARFEVAHELGVGGFGRAYLATVRGRDKSYCASTSKVCVKITTHIQSWIREAYFGLLLHGEDRALTIYDFFPLQRAAKCPVYCLVLEYAAGGDLGKYLRNQRGTWTEARVRREIQALLRVLNILHERKGLHRDLSPLNVFVCAGDRLKIGDFGIAVQSVVGNTVASETMTATWSPPEKWVAGKHRWSARDDVFQVGQLIGMLLRGDATSRLTKPDVRLLRCSDHLKEVIQRCIGPSVDRYSNASQLMNALETPVRPHRDRVASLAGMQIVFTGTLSVPRREASRLARKSGARIAEKITATTDVVVRGKPSANQNAGTRGVKLIKVSAMRSRGVQIRVIQEKRFMRLVAPP
jgi:serine/threonine protein kinase